MKLDKQYAPELMVAQDGTKSIADCYLDLTDTPSLVATTGHALIIVPVVKDDTDMQGIIPAKAIVAAKKIADKKTSTVQLRADSHVEVEEALTLFERPAVRFPDWRHALPVLKDGKVSVSLDPFKLLTLVRAMGADEKAKRTNVITLTFNPHAEAVSPQESAIEIRLDQSEARGVLMPCRSKEKR